MTRIFGLDLSLTATGIANSQLASGTIEPPGRGTEQRIRYILDECARWKLPNADLVAIEGPSYGSQGGKAHERAGLWWCVAYKLWALKIPVVVVAPGTLKKYATGHGHATKSDVRQAVIARWPAFNGDHNAADALMLVAFAADLAGKPITAMPDHHRVALKAVQLPDLGPWHGKAA